MFNEYLEGISKPQETFSITFSFSTVDNKIQLLQPMQPTWKIYLGYVNVCYCDTSDKVIF